MEGLSSITRIRRFLLINRRLRLPPSGVSPEGPRVPSPDFNSSTAIASAGLDSARPVHFSETRAFHRQFREGEAGVANSVHSRPAHTRMSRTQTNPAQRPKPGGTRHCRRQPQSRHLVIGWFGRRFDLTRDASGEELSTPAVIEYSRPLMALPQGQNRGAAGWMGTASQESAFSRPRVG